MKKITNKIIKYIKENIFDIKPIFKIQIKESWFSPNYVYIRYSPNNGHKWYNILRDERDLDEMNWRKQKVDVEYIEVNLVERFIEINQLNSLENCISYNNKIYEMVEEHNKKTYNEYINSRKSGIDFIEKFNNK